MITAVSHSQPALILRPAIAIMHGPRWLPPAVSGCCVSWRCRWRRLLWCWPPGKREPATALRLIQGHVAAMEEQLSAVQLAARLLQEEMSPDKERIMVFTFTETERAAQMAVAIRRSDHGSCLSPSD